jgi:hypothetical protein
VGDDDAGWLDDARYLENVRDDGELEVVARPVELTGFEVADEQRAAVRIGYRTAGTAAGPNVPLAEVVVVEDPEVISIILLERVTWGVTPEGWPIGEKLMAVSRFVEVALRQPVGGRRVIDGANGRRVEPLRLDDPHPRTRYGRGGCPRWVP